METNLLRVLVMSNCEVELLFEGLRSMALESLYDFWLVCSKRSHIHARNMAWGWRAKERFGSTILWLGVTWKSHSRLDFASSIRRYFFLYSYEHYTGLYEVIWRWVHWYFCPYYASYVYDLWQHICMDVITRLLVIEWSMYLWTNGWNGS